MSKKTHGGKRHGSGRPSIKDKKVTLTIYPRISEVEAAGGMKKAREIALNAIIQTKIKMKTLIIILLAAFFLSSCQEDAPAPLNGRYNFIEPPNPISRLNRLDNSEVAFDVIFTIQNETLTEVDMVIHAEQIAGASGSISGRDIMFTGNGAELKISGARKSGNTLQVSGAEFTIGGQTKTWGALQIDSY